MSLKAKRPAEADPFAYEKLVLGRHQAQAGFYLMMILVWER